MIDAIEQTAKKSVLERTHRELGAKFVLSYGWELVQLYSSVSDEHRAVRENGGLIDLSYDGSIKVRGSEAVQFLNGLVSNDVKGLGPGKGMRAAFLTGHGKVRALCRVLNLDGDFLILNDPQTHTKVLNYISPFSYAGDFKVEDVSEEYRRLSVQGPKSSLILKEICFEPAPSLCEHDRFQTLIAGHQALIVRASHTGEEGFDILAPGSALPDIWDFILLKGRFHSLVPFGLQALDSLRIEAGIPIYGIDVDETNMLLELGLEDAVSFKKGCYTGQEAVAMATYRGHVSKRLSGLTVFSDKLPARGAIVRKDGKEIGLITSATRSTITDSVIALAYLKYGFLQENSAVELECDGATLPARIVQLPFYKSA